MKHSESLANIGAALSKAQGLIRPALKTSENGHLKSKYADLGAVWDACREALAENGLSVIQMPDTDEPGYMALETMILHSSGEYIASRARMRLQKDDPQGAGSGLTYLRRYSLSAALGIVADDDDDGHAASQAAPRAQQARPAPKPAAPPPQSPPSGQTLTAKQAEQLHARLGPLLRGTDWDGQDDKAFAAETLGFRVGSFTELTVPEAHRVQQAAEALPKMAPT